MLKIVIRCLNTSWVLHVSVFIKMLKVTYAVIFLIDYIDFI